METSGPIQACTGMFLHFYMLREILKSQKDKVISSLLIHVFNDAVYIYRNKI